MANIGDEAIKDTIKHIGARKEIILIYEYMSSMPSTAHVKISKTMLFGTGVLNTRSDVRCVSGARLKWSIKI